MIIIRRAYQHDLDGVGLLAASCGIGITTLPNNRDLLEERINWACASFNKDAKNLSNDYYFFVAQLANSKQIVGTSAVETSIGYNTPFYSYKLSTHTQRCELLGLKTDYQMLNLTHDYHGASEICTLYLAPEHRVNGNGLLLSRARFLFMAQFPERFASTIIAEIRGVSNDQGLSAFWDAVGGRFFQMPFKKADLLTLSTNKQFIADLMPRSPIYVNLLSEEARSVIGQPHPSSASALAILLHEGFQYKQYVDIFDAGPTVEALTQHIATIASSRTFTIKAIQPPVHGKRVLAANTQIEFRAVMSHVLLDKDQQECIIDHETATGLNVETGDKLRIAPFEGEL